MLLWILLFFFSIFDINLSVHLLDQLSWFSDFIGAMYPWFKLSTYFSFLLFSECGMTTTNWVFLYMGYVMLTWLCNSNCLLQRKQQISLMFRIVWRFLIAFKWHKFNEKEEDIFFHLMKCQRFLHKRSALTFYIFQRTLVAPVTAPTSDDSFSKCKNRLQGFRNWMYCSHELLQQNGIARICQNILVIMYACLVSRESFVRFA